MALKNRCASALAFGNSTRMAHPEVLVYVRCSWLLSALGKSESHSVRGAYLSYNSFCQKSRLFSSVLWKCTPMICCLCHNMNVFFALIVLYFFPFLVPSPATSWHGTASHCSSQCLQEWGSDPGQSGHWFAVSGLQWPLSVHGQCSCNSQR